MTASILAVDLSKPPQVAKSGSGWFFAVAGLLILIAGGGWIYIQNVKSAHMPAVVGRPVAEQAPLPPGNLKPNEEPYESPDAAASPSAADPSSAAPDTGVEVDLTTAVPPPAKKGTAPAESPKSQAKPANRRGNIPPLNLSAPTSNDDGPTTTNVEPPPDVSGHSAASGNGEPLNKIAVYSAANVPRPTSPASAGSLPVGGKVIEPKLIWSEPPVYPIPAKEANIQGDVKIDATINESGHVAKMKVISGPTLLQQAALNAVRNWKYEPSTLDGKPVLSQLVVTVQFRR